MIYKCERCGWEGEGAEGCGTHGCNPPPTIEALRAFAERLAKNQVELDAESKRVLYANIRKFYAR